MAMTTSLKEMATMRIRRSRLGLLGAVVAFAAFAPATAQAADSFGIETFTTTTSSSQAGGHPDLTTVTSLNTDTNGNPIERNKDLTVTLPQGFIGNPQNVPVCHMSQLATNQCDPSTQVGTLVL